MSAILIFPQRNDNGTRNVNMLKDTKATTERIRLVLEHDIIRPQVLLTVQHGRVRSLCPVRH